MKDFKFNNDVRNIINKTFHKENENGVLEFTVKEIDDVMKILRGYFFDVPGAVSDDTNYNSSNPNPMVGQGEESETQEESEQQEESEKQESRITFYFKKETNRRR